MCNKEIDHAVRNGKRILPIVIRDTNEKFVPAEISKRNWVFCREGQDDFGKAITDAHETIQSDYEWLKYHMRLQIKTLEWERTKDASRLLRGNELREADEKLAKSQKDPVSTEMQGNYLLPSHKNEEKQRRRVTIGLTFSLIVVSFLAVFAWMQRNVAISEKNRAEEQTSIALARQLVVQAQPKCPEGYRVLPPLLKASF